MNITRSNHRGSTIGICLAMLTTAAAGAVAEECPATLGYLSSRLPNYDDSDLQQMRNAGISTDLRAALQTAQSQGYSAQQTAAGTLAQARQAEAQMPEAEECIRQAAAAPTEVIRQLQAGTYRFARGSITTTCAKQYVLAYYDMIINREAAIGLSCWASQVHGGAVRQSPTVNSPPPRGSQQVAIPLNINRASTTQEAYATAAASALQNSLSRLSGQNQVPQSGHPYHNTNELSKPDLYTQLIKLDDLHKRGILSDQEYDAQKKKLLSAN